jgi:hypothetical protein
MKDYAYQQMNQAAFSMSQSVLLSLDTVIAVSIFVVLLSLISIIIVSNIISFIILAIVVLKIGRYSQHECCTLQLRT